MCRGLFRDRGVLHRDIRPDNLLWNDSSTIPAAGAAPVPTVFISHLLDPRYVIFPMWELILAESHASEPKHKSSIILIDFDNAEIYTSNERVKGGRSVSFIRFSLYDKSVMKAQGTPFFMAQAIRKGGPLSKPPFPLFCVVILPLSINGSTPIVSSSLEMKRRGRRDWVAKKLDPCSGTSSAMMGNPLSWFSSGGLCLLLPKAKGWCTSTRCLSSQGWTRRTRYELTILLKDDDLEGGFVHPEYRQFLPLVKSMLNLIKSDYHWVKEEKYKHPEYLHDALQRVILNFVLENKEASFMDLQKSPEYRPVKIINEPAPLSAATTERRRCISILGRKRKATSSTAPGIQRLSLASSIHKSHLGRLQVCRVAWTVSTIELRLFPQVRRARMPATAESFRDTGGHRKVYEISIIHTSPYWFVDTFYC